jgi:hypothetical protein
MIHSCEAPLEVILQKPWLWQDLVPWSFEEARAKRSMRWSCELKNANNSWGFNIEKIWYNGIQWGENGGSILVLMSWLHHFDGIPKDPQN